MIIKANRHNHASKLARYMMSGNHEKGEIAQIYELKGFVSENIRDAFRDVEVMAQATKADNALFHVQVRLREHERLTSQQWEHVADRIQKTLGLDGQPRAICFHKCKQTGERHMHIGISLIDQEEMKAIPVPFFKYRMKALSRLLENELQLSPVRNDRDGPIKYSAKKNEQEQARRLGTDIESIRNTIRTCWDSADCGRAFQNSLDDAGLSLARGDRRCFVVVDHAGGLHALGKRILDVNKTTMLSRLADIDLERLPSVEQARSALREIVAMRDKERNQSLWDGDRANQKWEEAVINAAIDDEKIGRRFVEPRIQERTKKGSNDRDRTAWEETSSTAQAQFRDAALETAGSATPEKPLRGAAKPLWRTYQSAPDPSDFLEKLNDRGIAFALVTADEAYKSHRESEFAKAIKRTSPVFEEGEIVVIRESGTEYLKHGEWRDTNRIQKLDQSHAGKYLEILGIDKTKLRGISETKLILEAVAVDRAAYWSAIRLEQAQTIKRQALVGRGHRAGLSFAKRSEKLAGAVFNAAEKVFEGLFSLLDPPTTPVQRNQAAEKARLNREAEAQRSIDISKFLAEHAQDRCNDEQQQAGRDRQRERDRDR